MSSRRPHTNTRSNDSQLTTKEGSLLYFKLPPTLGSKIQRLGAASPRHIKVIEMLVDRMLERVERGHLVLLLCLTLGLSACGSDPPVAPAPLPPANVAGNWSGTLQGTQTTGGNFLVAAVMVLNQSDATVTGTWGIQGTNGTVTGTTTTGAFAGTFTWNAGTVAGVPCTGTWAVAGPAGANTLTWSSPVVTGNCGNLPTNLVLAMQRR